MGGQNLRADLEALNRFKSDSDERADSFDKVVRKLEEARVGQESFGMMPGSGDIYSAYEDRVNSCLDSLKACAEAARDIGELVAGCGENYQNIDSGISEGLDGIMKELREGTS